MRTIPQSTARWLGIGLVALLGLAALHPGVARADTNLVVGAHAHVAFSDGDQVRLRSGPSYDDSTITMVDEWTTVDVLDGPFTAADGSVWYQVQTDSDSGYMVSDYLAIGPGTDAADSQSASDATSSDTASGDSQSSSDSGQAIVNFAMQYLGYPYVAATHGPDSFDCSGFTYWVVENVLGIDIGTGLWTQVAAGTPVDERDLLPGDLVFFQNTFEAGLSHVGIYIGNGQFIHAENPSTGVVISNLSDPYYAADWYGAVRLT